MCERWMQMCIGRGEKHTYPLSTCGICQQNFITLYRANPNYLRNPKFCVGIFEFYLSKILRQHLKQGKK